MFILADDLTGAADTGVAFAKRGLRAVLRLGGAQQGGDGAAVNVVSSDSRNVPVEEALVRVTACLSWATVPFYKKIDSVLRGHVAAELVACMRGLGLDRALVAPAFPAQGRTTREGMQWVRGQRVEVSLADALVKLQPLPVSVLALREGTIDRGQITEALAQPGIVIADAETDEHLDAIVRAAITTEVKLWCGSAGLAHALARHRQPMLQAAVPIHPDTPKPTLIVAGSDHANTRQQLAALRERGIGLIELSADNDIEQAANGCVAALQSGHSIGLCLPALPHQPEMATRLAQRLGEAALAVMQQLPMSPRLLLTGGDTALAVCAALHANAIELHDEIEAGVPRGQLVGGWADGASVITKSGGFGDRETLWRVLRADVTGLKDL